MSTECPRCEALSAEFEGDCWKAMRSLLTECHFDWRDTEPDGISAEEAREYISTTIEEVEKGEQRQKARAEAAEASAAAMLEALTRLLSLCEAGGHPFEEPNHAVVRQARAALSRGDNGQG